MKRFISRKRIKVPRYKLLYLKTIFMIVLIISLNLIITLGINNNNKDFILNILVNNSFGSIIPSFKKSYYSNLFWKNIYGFKIKEDKRVTNTNDNIKDIVIDSKKLSNPIIYIYNTFQTSKYKSTNYHSYNINSLVTQASKILEEYLKEKGISSLVETSSVAKVLKDNNLAYTYSYRGSRILMDVAKKQNNSLEYFLDIQISNNKYEATTAKINDVSYAKILFVVGTENNNYAENQKFANKLNEILISKNKELSRGVSLRGGTGYHGVYNEDFSPNTLLIEVGGIENTMEEVNRTLKILAEVLNNYMEDKNEKKE